MDSRLVFLRPLGPPTSLTLATGSTNVMELSKNGNTNDQVVGVSTLSYGGTLILRNLGGMLAPGDNFPLFSASGYSGAFSRVLSETPGQVVTWDTSKLTVNGTVKVATVAPAPVTITSGLSGGNLALSWPANQIGWRLLTQTNHLGTGISTNALDWATVPGSSNTNQVFIPLNPAVPGGYYRLVFP